MKSKNLGLGIFILSIGILWLLFNFKILDWSVLNSLLTLWPLLLVMIGVNIVFGNNQIVKSLSWLAFLAVVIIYGYINPNINSNNAITEVGNVSVDKEIQTKSGEVKIELGGVRLNVGADTKKLFDAIITNPYTENTIQYQNDKEVADIRFFQKGKIGIVTGKKTNDNFDLNLNKDIVWDMTVKVGAASGTLDMSQLKIEKLDVETGAVNLDLVFGDNIQFSDVKIDSGASNIEVTIPDSVGVRIKFDGGLSSTNLKELNWENKGGYYVSPNFDQASSKINFDVDMGVGKFEIKR